MSSFGKNYNQIKRSVLSDKNTINIFEQLFQVPFMVQNVYMYMDSIVVNVFFLVCKGELSSAFTSEAVTSILQVSISYEK